jgi:predicted DCC family thiol-disulfide oxidoreductase YuxK
MSSSAQPPEAARPILLFDGVCNLCNGVVRFVIRRDPAPGSERGPGSERAPASGYASDVGNTLTPDPSPQRRGGFASGPGRFRFAALQSEPGQRLLRAHGLPANRLDTFVMIEGGRAYTQSTAGLRVVRRLGFPWSLFYAFIIIPRPLRDAVYTWISRHRYGWFGQREVCMTPSDTDRARFLD